MPILSTFFSLNVDVAVVTQRNLLELLVLGGLWSYRLELHSGIVHGVWTVKLLASVASSDCEHRVRT